MLTWTSPASWSRVRFSLKWLSIYRRTCPHSRLEEGGASERARRIQESRFLLTETDHTLSQIARILGFSSLSYFSQSFRRLEGVSPMEYRRRHRRQGG